ncbi:MAG TPA: NAD(P)-binding domain-containing protein, partial [Caulobacteraceae bacterium]
MSFSRIALIGFGEVGQILAQDLAAAGVTDLAAWDILFARTGSGPSLAAAGKVRMASGAADAAADAELVI